jgi:hypothetical protein
MQSSGQVGTHLDSKEGFFKTYNKLNGTNKTMAVVFVVFSVSIYLSLFLFTGWLLASLTGWPIGATVGLIFLARLCLT